MATMAPRTPTGKPMYQRGFTYLMLIFVVAIMGVLLASTALVWHTVAKHEKERELLYAGHAFRRAIGQYYEQTPGAAKQYPKTLADLLDDRRQAALTRYLRKIYLDPLTASRNWGLVPGPNDTIMGVYSLSREKPLKTGNFDTEDADLEGKNSYHDWQFSYFPTPPIPTPTPTLEARPTTNPTTSNVPN